MNNKNQLPETGANSPKKKLFCRIVPSILILMYLKLVRHASQVLHSTTPLYSYKSCPSQETTPCTSYHSPPCEYLLGLFTISNFIKFSPKNEEGANFANML